MGRRSDHSREELRRMALDSARLIVAAEGLSALSTRKIARAIGYTVGTLYQVFAGADDLIEQMNAETLDRLHDFCSGVDLGAGPAASLPALAQSYMHFTQQNSLLWKAIFDHRPPPDYARSDAYESSVRRLLGLVERAIAPLSGIAGAAVRLHEARVLWAGLYGITSLATAGQLSKEEDPRAMVDTLIGFYIAAHRPSA